MWRGCGWICARPAAPDALNVVAVPFYHFRETRTRHICGSYILFPIRGVYVSSIVVFLLLITVLTLTTPINTCSIVSCILSCFARLI